jgi:methylenetetrahydrofolate--tRNA-(uracil-5-)-methyltransferase
MPPLGTMLGALYHYITEGALGEFQPMNANLGLLPPLPRGKGQSKLDRKAAQCALARAEFAAYAQQFSAGASAYVYQQGVETHAETSL